MWQALLAPFKHPMGALRAVILIAGLPMLLLIGTQILTGVVLAQDYMAQSNGSDPILAQHLLWLVASPEMIPAVIILASLPLAPWGIALWWRALDREPGWRVPPRHVLKVAGLMLLVLVPFLAEAVFFALGPILPPSIDTVIWGLVPVISVLAFLRLAPRFAAALDCSSGPTPGWGRVAITAAVFVIFGLVLQILSVLGWLGGDAVLRAILSSNGQPPLWIARILFLDWEMILSQFALLYAFLVLIALAYRLTQRRTETSASAE